MFETALQMVDRWFSKGPVGDSAARALRNGQPAPSPAGRDAAPRPEAECPSMPVEVQRYEYKYVIPADLVAPITSFLGPYCEMDPYSALEETGYYPIRTLYLDSPDYRTFWDKENDRPVRLKLRVRAYRDDEPGPVKFEVKQRYNDISIKTSVPVPEGSWPRHLGPDRPGTSFLKDEAERTAYAHFLFQARALRAAPAMLILYHRKALRSRVDPYVRISFDRRIRHQHCRNYSLSGQPDVWVPNDGAESLGAGSRSVVMEIKFTPGPPAWLSEMVCRFGLTRGGYSKYCTAMRKFLDGNPAAQQMADLAPCRRAI